MKCLHDIPGSQLLQCPFCGGSPNLMRETKNKLFVVMCNICLSELGMRVTAKEAIELWNTRVDNFVKGDEA